MKWTRQLRVIICIISEVRSSSVLWGRSFDTNGPAVFHILILSWRLLIYYYYSWLIVIAFGASLNSSDQKSPCIGRFRWSLYDWHFHAIWQQLGFFERKMNNENRCHVSYCGLLACEDEFDLIGFEIRVNFVREVAIFRNAPKTILKLTPASYHQNWIIRLNKPEMTYKTRLKKNTKWGLHVKAWNES